MNIIIPDIDQAIMTITELPELVTLGCVNKYFYRLVSDQPIIKQWSIIKNICKGKSINDIFIQVCKNGFLSYGMFLIKKNNINIHVADELPFRWCCSTGNIEMANWLIKSGESGNYGKKINIHSADEDIFTWRCYNGDIEMARWLIQLGESSDYGKINIHADRELAFRWSCYNGHIEIVRWLIRLGESGDYGKIDINVYNDDAFISSCANRHIKIAHLLIQLGESKGYNKIDQKIIDKYIKN